AVWSIEPAAELVMELVRKETGQLGLSHMIQVEHNPRTLSVPVGREHREGDQWRRMIHRTGREEARRVLCRDRDGVSDDRLERRTKAEQLGAGGACREQVRKRGRGLRR